jgi:hypothetical protein
MNMTRLLVIAAILAGIGAPAHATDIMFARSSGDWKAAEKPGRYSAMNILDGDKRTVWCSDGSGLGATLEIQLSKPVTLEKMDISMGNQKSPSTFSDYNRVRKLRITGGEMSHPFELEDKVGSQTLHFDPAITTDRLILKLTAGYRGNKVRHTCISDAIIYKGRRALSNKKIKKKIKKARKKMTFIDAWVSGADRNKPRLLVLGLGDQYRLEFVPQDPTEASVFKKGSWRIKGRNPEIKVDRRWIPVRVRRDDADRVQQLKLVGLDLLDGVYMRRSEAETD